MHLTKYMYSLMVLILGLGMLYSQVCGVICIFSRCSESGPVRVVANVEHTGHCHQDRSSSQPDPLPDDPHKCSEHNSTVSILPPGAVSVQVLHQVFQLATVEIVHSSGISLDIAGKRAGHGSHFRSPPHPPRFTVLRI